MKRYRSRLATVLRVRHIHQDLARAELVRAGDAARAAASAAEAATDHYAAVRAELPVDDRVPSALALRQRVELAGRSAAAATAAAVHAGAARDTARTLYVEASARVTVIDNLEQRRRAEHAVAAQREEIAAIDDLVTARYVREARS